MKRFACLLSIATLFVSAGCCGARQCSPCGGGGMGYGVNYAPQPYMSAPSYAPTCPNGNCGPMYQSGSVTTPYQQAYTPTHQQAYTPYSSTVAMDHVPAF